jgi:hypothetical protein
VRVEQRDVVAMYTEGVSAIEAVTSGWSSEHWQQTASGKWSALDLAGHLVCVIDWYHQWLSAAEQGSADPPFSADDLSARNDKALVELEIASPEERIARFVTEAHRYAARLPAQWETPYGFPYGTITAGLHAGVAAGEWHLHAWDLSGGTHRPVDPAALFRAVGAGMSAAQGKGSAAVAKVVLPLVARRQPWKQLLHRSGR